MGIKRRIRSLFAGSIRTTAAISDRTRKTVESVLNFPKRNKLKKIGEFELEGGGSEVDLIVNEFECDLQQDDLPGPSTSSCDTLVLAQIHSCSSSSSLCNVQSQDSLVLNPTGTENENLSVIQSKSVWSRIVSREKKPFDFEKDEKHKKGGKKSKKQKDKKPKKEKSIQIISREQYPVIIVKSKLRQRLSLKGLKKSGKGVRKVLTSGFKAMGNSMIYATHAIPVPYECPSSYDTRTRSAVTGRTTRSDWDDDYYEYEEDRKKYIAFWARALEKQQQQREEEEFRSRTTKTNSNSNYDDDNDRSNSADTCHQFQLR